MDEGNQGEEAASRPGPFPDQNHLHILSQQQHYSSDHSRHLPDQILLLPDHDPGSHGYSFPDNSLTFSTAPATESRPSQIPVASYAPTNFQAFAANARSGDDVLSDPVDPDDFYRSYRGGGVQSGTSDVPRAPSPDPDPMASAIPTIRSPPSLRPNGDATTLKQPAASTGRTGSRPGVRSVSNPVDDRLASSVPRAAGNGYGPSGAFPPSVKDLKKKFDQSASQSTTQNLRKTPRTSRDTASNSANGRYSGVGGGATSHSASRTTAARDTGHEAGKGSGARATQRQRSAAEDQSSASSQSFASRISRPRNAVQTSKSMTQLSPTASPKLSTSNSAPPRPNGLLFGEILPEDNDSVTVGFGIDGPRPRRTSESSVHELARSRMRSSSDPDMEPASPTDWYRGAALGQQDADQRTSRPSKYHARAHSDYAGSKAAVNRLEQHVAKQTTDLGASSPTSPTSRLPIMVKRTNVHSNNASPASTRSNSPAMKHTPASGRNSRQHQRAASRAKTPVTRSHTPTTQSKAPSASVRKQPPSNIATTSSGRLNAYVSVPAPKTSPSLRSSRPRQSVATATTAASRMRVVDRALSPTKSGQRVSSSVRDEATTRRRKVSVGPIDFAQRRETIKLAYSKSIRDAQAREARQVAADKRKKELETVARIKIEAEAAALAAMPAPSSQPIRMTERTSHREKTIPEEPLKITTNLPLLQTAVKESTSVFDSPTLGMPGSFPDAAQPTEEQEEVPQSAISVATEVTEFDTEEQTEPPRQESTTTIDEDLGFMLVEEAPSQPEVGAAGQPILQQQPKRTSYHSPFDEDGMDEDGVSIKIALDASLQPSRQPTPTLKDFEPEPVSEQPRPETDPEPEPTFTMPSQSTDEYEPQPYVLTSQVYETTVTILGPDHDFKPSHKDPSRDTMSSSELLRSSGPLVTETSPAAASASSVPIDPQSGVEPNVDMEGLERLEDFYVGTHLRDNIASLRDSTFTASDVDVDTSYGAQPSSSEQQKTPDTAHSLTIPPFLAPGNRLSQNSVWTDFSFGSDADPDLSTGSKKAQPLEGKTGSGLDLALGDFGSKETGADSLVQSPDLSPREQPKPPSPSMVAESPIDPRQPLDLDTGKSFIPYLPEAKRVPELPEHSPPPPPAGDYELDETVYDAETRPNSYVHQDDDSEDLTQSIYTPHSTGQLSLETRDATSISLSRTESKIPSTGAQDSLDHEQKRLRQRQLVIRELLDTEDIFVRDMSVVEEIYKGTAEACPRLESKTIKLIFRNTDEIIAFHASFLGQLKEGAASVYTPKGRRSPTLVHDSARDSDSATLFSNHSGLTSINKHELDDERDRQTCIGPLFLKNIDQLKAVHELYLRSSDQSAKRLIQIQEDPAVKVWLNECSEVAKELTTAWSLDSLLIKPMQRITKYPDIIAHLLKHTPADHPDREALANAKATVINAIDEINKTKRNFELVGQIVGSRKRKESDVRAGLARAFGKRVDKLQASSNSKAPEDEEYLKLRERFGDEYIRLQVVLRDVEFYTRNVATYVREFLQYLSSIELVMRLQPSRDFAHIESKWVQFNVSMRDIEKIALEKHLADVRKHVIEPFEQVIRCYGNPSLAMKKRAKRRLDYEKYMLLKSNGKKVDKQLSELVEQYEALNETLKKELPKLSDLTTKIGNICLGKFVSIQATWYGIWKEKVKMPLQDVTSNAAPELSEIVSTFQREFMLQEERAMAIGILNPTVGKGRSSQSTTDGDASSVMSRTRSRPGELLGTPRARGLSINSEHIPSLPTPDFAKRNSGQFSLSPTSTSATLPSPGHYYRDFYSGITNNGGQHGRGMIAGSPGITPDLPTSSSASFGPRIAPTVPGSASAARPNTGRSYDSGGTTLQPRQSSDSTIGSGMIAQGLLSMTPTTTMMNIAGMRDRDRDRENRRDSNSTFSSSVYYPNGGSTTAFNNGETRRLSGLFHSALPLPDGPEDSERESSGGRNLLFLQRGSSRASSRTRSAGGQTSDVGGGGYNVLWLAASLFEFNIESTKHEAGYPYLTYQAGEIFDVIAEKGELWLAKNQDDPKDVVGWIWSKHFAKLADS